MAAELPRTLDNFTTLAAQLDENPREASACLQSNGLLRVRGALPRDQAEALSERVRKELEERREDGDPKWFGDVYGYEDTSSQRWDLKLRLSPEVRAALRSLLGRLELVLESLRSSWQLTELAAMCTFPGDPGQPVHADTSHIYDQQAMTIFVALHDISPERGPTKMYPRTHTDGEVHMGFTKVDETSAVLCTMQCGDCVIMDSRLLHCGTANTTDLHRYLFYTSWMPQGRRSRGSTNTILPDYEERLYLRSWRDWTTCDEVEVTL
ncbi:unnamed protein product [Polarella glacialis]|uniref:Phytanoyl-CoA dioxygenase n=1 Tax=Polarella glacialis TaxID=89957 RepID=A0A813JGV5_POLGL|nr:unnamed protein product [Polarella glacialis]